MFYTASHFFRIRFFHLFSTLYLFIYSFHIVKLPTVSALDSLLFMLIRHNVPLNVHCNANHNPNNGITMICLTVCK